MRKIKFIPNSYYHICNRSNDERPMFLDDKDYARLLFSILFYQAPVYFNNIGRQTSCFVKHLLFNISSDIIDKVIKTREVELNIFAIMPNHFHLLIREKNGKGISRYLQRIQNGYAKYFNTKYKK